MCRPRTYRPLSVIYGKCGNRHLLLTIGIEIQWPGWHHNYVERLPRTRTEDGQGHLLPRELALESLSTKLGSCRELLSAVATASGLSFLSSDSYRPTHLLKCYNARNLTKIHSRCPFPCLIPCGLPLSLEIVWAFQADNWSPPDLALENMFILWFSHLCWHEHTILVVWQRPDPLPLFAFLLLSGMSFTVLSIW